MRHSKFISLLQKLDTRERRRFREFVNSPFFNKHEALKKLSDYILDKAPNFDDNNLDKKAIFKKLFPNEKYSEQRIYTLLSNLMELLNTFLSQIHFQDNQLQVKRYSMTELRKRKEFKQWQTVKKQHNILSQKAQHSDANQLFENYGFYEEADKHFLSLEIRSFDRNLQLKSQALDYFYFAEKLKIACDMLSRNMVIKADYKNSFQDEFLDILKRYESDFLKIPAIDSYFSIYCMLIKSSEDDFRNAMAVLKKHLGKFSAEETKIQFDYCVNFCIKQLNSGNPLWYREFLDLHRFLLDEEIILVNGTIAEWDYKNIVTVSLRIGDLKWAEKFIENYKDALTEEVRENAYSYNLASLYFTSGQYKKAMQLLLTVNFTDESYQLGAKITQLKTYYELQEWEAGLSLINAFKQLVSRSRLLSDYRMESNINMLKASKKLFELCRDHDFLKNSELKKQIKILSDLLLLTPIANLSWLQEKVSELEREIDEMII